MFLAIGLRGGAEGGFESPAEGAGVVESALPGYFLDGGCGVG